MKVKICGLNPVRDVQLCIDLKVSFLGFVFYKKSPRNLNVQDIDRLKDYDRKKSSFCAVTVNPDDEFIKNRILNNFDYIQLHGSETNGRIKEIRQMGLKVIKAVKIKEESDITKHKDFDAADLILFDTPGMEKSIEFPKNLISKLPHGEKFGLAGSISADNVENIANMGVKFFDISSKLETDFGQKDHLKIRSFINIINRINE